MPAANLTAYMAFCAAIAVTWSLPGALVRRRMRRRYRRTARRLPSAHLLLRVYVGVASAVSLALLLVLHRLTAI